MSGHFDYLDGDQEVAAHNSDSTCQAGRQYARGVVQRVDGEVVTVVIGITGKTDPPTCPACLILFEHALEDAAFQQWIAERLAFPWGPTGVLAGM